MKHPIERQERFEEVALRLLEALSIAEPDGTSAGGPLLALADNDETRKIVAMGEPVVPVLIDRLGKANLNETTLVVFCLFELRAKGALIAVQELKITVLNESRFGRRDGNLELQIENFLRGAETW